MSSWWRRERKRPDPASGSGAVRFLIICAARTGSTMLRHLLNSHPDLCCHGEVFGPAVMRNLVGVEHRGKSPLLGKLQTMRDADPASFLREYVFYAGSCSAVGAKILYQTFDHDPWRPLRKAVLEDRNIRIVHLFRRNRLKRYVSETLSRSTEHPKVIFDPKDRPAQRSLMVPPEECLADMRRIEREEARFRDLFRSHQCHEICYEDLLLDQNDTLSGVQRFLGVTPRHLTTSTLKVNSDSLADIVDNYRELAARLSGTEYHHFLDAKDAHPGA